MTDLEIRSVTTEGVEFVDELGNTQFIDFSMCYQNYLKREIRAQIPYVTEGQKRPNTILKYVGQRDVCGNPPYIELFTDPLTRFEFNSSDQGFYEFEQRIRRAGWKTLDLS